MRILLLVFAFLFISQPSYAVTPCALTFFLKLWPAKGSIGFLITDVYSEPLHCAHGKFTLSDDRKSFIFYRQSHNHFQRVRIPIPQDSFGQFYVYYLWGKHEGKINGNPITVYFHESPYRLAKTII